MCDLDKYIISCSNFAYCYSQGRRNEKRARKGGGGGLNVVEGHRQNFNHVKVTMQEFGGSVAFFLNQHLTNYILGIASAITLGINISSISSFYSATAGFIISKTP